MVNMIKISQIKSNPNNPRLIKDDKFYKLVKSLEEDPDFCNVRPVVVNKDMIVLGGNMRLKAAKELGWKEIPCEIVDWSDDKQRAFTIKDNVGYGEWDWDMLANEWDAEQLNEWGLNVPQWANGHEINSMNESELDMLEEFDPIGKSSGLQRVVFIFDGPEEAESYLNNLNVKFEKRNMAWQVNLNTLFTS